MFTRKKSWWKEIEDNRKFSHLESIYFYSLAKISIVSQTKTIQDSLSNYVGNSEKLKATMTEKRGRSDVLREIVFYPKFIQFEIVLLCFTRAPKKKKKGKLPKNGSFYV